MNHQDEPQHPQRTAPAPVESNLQPSSVLNEANDAKGALLQNVRRLSSFDNLLALTTNVVTQNENPWINRYSACGGIWVRAAFASVRPSVWDAAYLQHAVSVGLTCLIDERHRIESLVNPKSGGSASVSASRRVKKVLRRGRRRQQD
tara:strand:+ start:987 stop:1427 length:441 start_codon:yes stop_codon:yes gene_type:complete